MRFHAVAAAATGLLLGNVTLASYVNFPADSVHTRDFDADLYSRDYDYETIGSDMLYARQLLDDVFELVARTPVFSERLPTSSSSSSSYRYDSGSYGYSTGSDANRAQPPPAPASVPSTSGRTSGYSTTPGTTTTPGSGSSAGRTPYQVGSDLKSGGVSLPNDARAAQDISIGTPKDKYEIGRSEAQVCSLAYP